jgi:hypothetical protein
VRSGSDRRQRVDLTLGEYARSKIWVPFQREHGVAMEVLEGDGRIFGVMSEKLRGSQSTGGARVLSLPVVPATVSPPRPNFQQPQGLAASVLRLM